MIAAIAAAAVAMVGVALYSPVLAAPSAGANGAPQPEAAAAADGVVDAEDGLLPDDATPFDDTYPGLANLAADLRHALQRAAHDAAADGVVVRVNSGWRSAEYQDQLLREAVAEYGSAAEAARWVASAATSSHVAGEAVDVGSYDAVEWLAARGAVYGLCQTYGNESWHFELRPEAVGHGCPPPYADPTHDPRLQR